MCISSSKAIPIQETPPMLNGMSKTLLIHKCLFPVLTYTGKLKVLLFLISEVYVSTDGFPNSRVNKSNLDTEIPIYTG